MQQRVPDVHMEKPANMLRINRVGIKNAKLPPVKLGEYWAIPYVSAYVDLPESHRGAHISRLYKVVYEVFSEYGSLDYDFLEKTASKLIQLHEGSSNADVSFKANLIGNVKGHEFKGSRSVLARLVKNVNGDRYLYSGVSFIVVTACPCAMEVSRHLYNRTYTHNAIMRVSVVLKSRSSVPHPVDLLKSYELVFTEPSNYLNRVGEAELVKKITENPRFAEDVAREAARIALESFSRIIGGDGRVYVKVNSIEPLHEYRISVRLAVGFLDRAIEPV